MQWILHLFDYMKVLSLTEQNVQWYAVLINRKIKQLQTVKREECV